MGVTKSESHPHFSFFLEVSLSLFFKYPFPVRKRQIPGQIRGFSIILIINDTI